MINKIENLKNKNKKKSAADSWALKRKSLGQRAYSDFFFFLYVATSVVFFFFCCVKNTR